MTGQDRSRRRLIEAIQSADIAAVHAAIAAGCSVSGPSAEMMPEDTTETRTPLIWAVNSHFLEAVQALAAAGTELDERPPGWEPALHAAIQWQSVPMISALIEAGARLQSLDQSGRNAAHLAAELLDIDVLLALEPHIEPGMLASLDRGGRTPLMSAAKADFPEAIAFFARLGADPNQLGRRGDRAINVAASGKAPKAVRALLALGSVDLEAETPAGFTPLALAARYGHEEVAAALLRGGADPFRTSAAGVSPLSEARARHAMSSPGTPRGAIEEWADAELLRRSLDKDVARPARAGRAASI